MRRSRKKKTQARARRRKDSASPLKKAPAPKPPTEGIVPYHEFRTGLTYQDVFYMLWSFSDDSSTWKYKRRRTVLGKWHQIKKEMYAHYLNYKPETEVEPEPEPEPEASLNPLDSQNRQPGDDNEEDPFPTKSHQATTEDELPF